MQFPDVRKHRADLAYVNVLMAVQPKHSSFPLFWIQTHECLNNRTGYNFLVQHTCTWQFKIYGLAPQLIPWSFFTVQIPAWSHPYISCKTGVMQYRGKKNIFIKHITVKLWHLPAKRKMTHIKIMDRTKPGVYDEIIWQGWCRKSIQDGNIASLVMTLLWSLAEMTAL